MLTFHLFQVLNEYSDVVPMTWKSTNDTDSDTKHLLFTNSISCVIFSQMLTLNINCATYIHQNTIQYIAAREQGYLWMVYLLQWRVLSKTREVFIQLGKFIKHTFFTKSLTLVARQKKRIRLYCTLTGNWCKEFFRS